MRRWQLENYNLMPLGKISRSHSMTIKFLKILSKKQKMFSIPFTTKLSVNDSHIQISIKNTLNLYGSTITNKLTHLFLWEIKIYQLYNQINIQRYQYFFQIRAITTFQMIANDPVQLGETQQSENYLLKKIKFHVETPRKNLTCLHVFENTLYVGTRQSKLYIYRIEGFNLSDQKVLIPHCEIVSSVTANENFFITVAESDDQMPVGVWNSKTRMFITALKSHSSQVSKVIFLKDPGYLATSSWDCTVKIWDIRNIVEWQNNVKTIKSQYPVLTITQVSDDVIAFGGDDCYINFYNWRDQTFLGKYFGHAGSVTLIYSQFPYILTAGGDHKLKQWEFLKKKSQNSSKLNQMQFESRKQIKQIKQKEFEQGGQNNLIKITKQVKKIYDSSIFLIKINQSDIFLLDRHGNRFLHRFEKDFITSQNNFQYNENITGMVLHEGKIFVTTTKGQLKCFEVEILKNPFTES